MATTRGRLRPEGGPATVALVRASHPGPAAAVTVLVTLLATTWGASVGTTLLVAAATILGQLSVGWCNDLADVDRDTTSGRSDKPLATGLVSVRLVRAALGVSVAATIVTSLLLGAGAGLLHLALVGTGWSYNLVLKRTVASWVPYAICFGGLPVVVSLAVRGDPGPVWPVVAGALLGTGAHLVNAVPDLEDDRLTGVVGLPHRLGAQRSIDLATLLMLVGTVVTLVVPADGFDAIAVIGLAGAAVLLLAGRATTGRGPFRAAVGIAVLDVIVLLLRS